MKQIGFVFFLDIKVYFRLFQTLTKQLCVMPYFLVVNTLHAHIAYESTEVHEKTIHQK